MMLHVLAGRPAIRIVLALWAIFAVLLAVNLTLRLTPQEVRFVHQSPPAQSTSVQPTAPPVPIIVEAPPKVAPVLPPPRRGAEVQVQLTRAPAAPSPVQRSKAAPAPVVAQTSRSKPSESKREPAKPAPVVEQEDPAPADPCAQACDDPPPPDESSPGGENDDPVQTTSPGSSIPEPTGES